MYIIFTEQNLKYFVLKYFSLYMHNQCPYSVTNSISWEVLQWRRVGQEYEKYCC